MSLYNIKKSQGLINSLLSVAKQSSSRRPAQVFQGSVFTRKLRFPQGQQTVSAVFLQVTGPLHSLLRKRVRNLVPESPWFVPQLSFTESVVLPGGKRTARPPSPGPQTAPCAGPRHGRLVCSPCLSRRVGKGPVRQGRFNEININFINE